MANPEHLRILKKGVKVWNDWRQEKSNVLIDLSNANLSNANLSFVNLSNALLENANLADAVLGDADLSNANLNYTNLTNAFLGSAILNKVSLNDATLNGVDLNHSKITKASLINTDLIMANLSHANLEGSELDGAILYESNLSRANLSYSNLSNTKLNGAILIETSLNKTNFTNAHLGKTIFSFTNLNSCLGLKTIKVSDICSIDFQTLKTSKNLPKEFLLKIGLPENYINYLPDFYDENPLRLYPVFLSHSSKNKDFAGKLYEALIQKGVKVWYDEKKLRTGDDLYEEISKGINVYDKMILVCSKESLDESWWVNEEMNRIFSKERQYMKAKGARIQLLIPITLDDYVFSWQGGKAESLKDKVIGDFSEWQDEAKFEKALNKLVDALSVDRDDGNVPSFFFK